MQFVLLAISSIVPTPIERLLNHPAHCFVHQLPSKPTTARLPCLGVQSRCISDYLSLYVHHRGMGWTLGNAVIYNADIKPPRIAFDPAFSHSECKSAPKYLPAISEHQQ